MSASLDRLAPVAGERPAAAIVAGLGLRDVHRAGEQLFMHYAAAA